MDSLCPALPTATLGVWGKCVCVCGRTGEMTAPGQFAIQSVQSILATVETVGEMKTFDVMMFNTSFL